MANSKSAIVLIIISFLVLVGLLVFSQTGSNQSVQTSDYLRIHIRANSNSIDDQKVKYEIKDEVVKSLIPLLSDAKSKQQSIEIIRENLKLVESVANEVLKENGFLYTSQASIKNEYFPTRTYDTLTLESDFYDALILNLGTGQGDNWWCVAYPPMCFVAGADGSTEVVYKSKLVEIVKKFFNS